MLINNVNHKIARSLIGLIIGVLVLGLSSCQRPPEPLVLEEQSVISIKDGANTSLKGKIEFVNWVTEDPELIQEIVSKFNEDYPYIEVEVTTIAFTDFRKTIMARHSAGISADVYQLNMPWAKELVNLGVLAPLDDMIEEDPSFIKEDFVQEPMQKVEGHTYMIPLTVMHFVLFCNTDHFEDAGLAYPTTWEELANAAETLTDEAANRYGFSMAMSSSGADNGPILSLYPLLYSAGGRTLKDGQPNLASDEVLDMMTYVDDLYASGSVMPGTLTKNGTQVIDDFAEGRASMMIQPSVHIINLKNREQASINFDIVRVPGPADNNVPATRLHGFELGISAESDNKELAWTLITWMTRAEENGWIAEELGQMPANLKADTSFLQKDPTLQKTYAMMRDLELVEELMLTPKSTDSWRLFTDHTQKMFLDEVSPQEAVEAIQEDWEILFSED